jgi:uncharacterized protein YprB with RNaseH-like and TPR domain
LRPPVHRLKKSDIIWLANHRCDAHSMDYLSHYNCFLKENPNQKRVCFFDIETSHLKANLGVILSYCILDNQTGEIRYAVVDPKDLRKKDGRDRKVVRKCLDDLADFDLIVGYYSSRFDIPYIRTRAMIWGMEFPVYGTRQQKDLYYTVKYKFALHSNRLDVACRTILGHSDKTILDTDIWMDAAYSGDPEALAYILKHNKNDVTDLKKLYDKVLDYSYPITRSI